MYEQDQVRIVIATFWKHCDVNKILQGSVKAEKISFDSVWVRDHFLFHPHTMGGKNNSSRALLGEEVIPNFR